ncbi:T9SS type A sorting domain-containing protein [Adhaeribacter sp. BT258]|uniref:T9SS type A sorting domain-containing protein n=1 Tax=Adhaeribacter terrigena TaxID=2793070 RepID=A0ABS1C2C5_9BACT|nr:T9SS type A sorting domain-containing protein [Adhaeribacter terrigena]MBK0403557.1 T9SS type A sorting domain-containing protein [Adhaeribacter terrigena]
MKKLLLALAVAVAAQCSAFAQGYTVTTTTGTYADLTGATVVSTSGWDPNTANFTIPIGFNFVLDGITYTSMETDGLGDLYFTDGTNDKYIYPFDAVIIDKSYPSTTSTLSPISYLLSGTAGSRILKVEFKNAGLVTDPLGTPTLNPNDVANFQVWLYEGSNKIEVRYGTVSAANVQGVFFGEDGPSVAVVTGISSTGISGFFLEGLATAPTVTVLNQSSTYMGLDNIPASGTIYTFNRVVSGIAKQLNQTNIAVYPNPVANVMTIKGLTAKGQATVTITDVLGKVVLTEKVAASQNVSVNVSNLKKGAYFVEVASEEGRSFKQIIRQ